MGELYCIVGPSGKRYIGWTTNSAARRFKSHVREAQNCKSKTALHRAIRRYGADQFTVITLLVAKDVSYLKRMECAAIAKFGSAAPVGYNLTPGGDGVPLLFGEARERWLKNLRLKFAEPAFRAKLRAAGLRNSHLSSSRLKANWGNVEWRAAQLQLVAASQSSADYKARRSIAVSKAQKKRFQDPEQLRIARTARLGKPHTVAVKRIIGEAVRKRWASVKYRTWLSSKQRASWEDPVVREKRTSAMRRAWVKRRLKET